MLIPQLFLLVDAAARRKRSGKRTIREVDGAVRRFTVSGSVDSTHLMRRRRNSRYLTRRHRQAEGTTCPLYRIRSIKSDGHELPPKF